MKPQNIPNLRTLLDTAPRRFGDRTFIRYRRGEEIVQKSYAAVRADSLAFCRYIRHVSPGRIHIAIISKSSYEYIVCLTGCIISGSVAVPVAPESTAEDAAAILNDADVSFVLYEHAFAEKAEALKRLCPQIEYTMDLGDAADFEALCRAYGEDSPYAALSEVDADPAACSLIIYTSGTTGDKKGVMLSQNALIANTMFTPHGSVLTRAVNTPDVVLSVLPLYHILCFTTDYLGPLKNGYTMCLNGDMRNLFQNLLLFKPNTMRIVPMIAQALLARIRAVAAQHPELSPKEAAALVTGGNLDLMFSGGAYLDPALARGFEAFGIFLRQGYGMSEAGCKITVPDEDTAVESVGRVMDIVDVRIRNGEIQVDTPCRMLGYYKRDIDTAAMFTPDGWLKTGDLGYLTEDRQLFITGRVKNLIILSNGENVSPEGIEKRYRAYPLVKEVRVYAEKDTIVAEVYPDFEYASQAGVADIPAALDAVTDELNCSAQPSHTVAKVVIRDTPLEKTATGKIKRGA